MTVTAAVFSADGTRVITSSGERPVGLTPGPVLVRTWDAATGLPAIPPADHHGDIAAWSPDGRRAVTIDGQVARLWDVPAWTQRGTPLEHEGTIVAAAFSRDGARVITASTDHSARIWEAATGKLVGSPLGHATSVRCAAFSPDGKHAATGSARTVRVWDLATGKPDLPPLEHSGNVSAVAFSPDGQRLATTDSYRTRLWNLAVEIDSLDHWRALARCSPFVLDHGVLQANPDTVRICPHH
jgi:WD40 repeat protein